MALVFLVIFNLFSPNKTINVMLFLTSHCIWNLDLNKPCVKRDLRPQQNQYYTLILLEYL